VGEIDKAHIEDIGGLHHPMYAEWLVPPAVATLVENGLSSPASFTFDTSQNTRVDSDAYRIEVGWYGDLSDHTGGKEFLGLIDPDRLTELAACAIGFLVIAKATNHRVREAVQKGRGPDYLLDDRGYSMEVSGTARRSVVKQRWEVRAEKTREYLKHVARELKGGYVLVVCFDPRGLGGPFSFHSRQGA